jgi:hypothetical protein
MRNLSRSAKLLIAIGLFIVLYMPVELLWVQVRPAYADFLAGVAEPVINLLEFSDTSYRVTAKEDNFEVVAHVRVGGQYSRAGQYELPGKRKLDLVTYNMSLWATLFLATVLFVNRRARLRYLIIAPLAIFVWHVCDLTIFAKNTKWILIKQLNGRFPAMVSYSLTWNWLWYWAQEFNRRIVDPFLPLLLWVVFCATSFFAVIRQKTDRVKE